MSVFGIAISINSELIQNAKVGNLEKVRDLLRRGANVNAKHWLFGNTALILASWKCHLEVVRTLLNHRGVDVNIKDNDGYTALILASGNGHLEVVRALLNHDGVDVNIKDNDGDAALTLASGNVHLEVVRALLMHNGVDVNIKDDLGRTALIRASYMDHLEVVRALLNHDGVDVNIKSNNGDTALICASWKGHLEVVRALLNHNGVDVNIKNENGETALHIACKKNNDDVARLLEEHMERERRVEEERKRREEEAQARLKEAERLNALAQEFVKRQFVKRREEEELQRREAEEKKRREDAVRIQALEEELEKRRKEEVQKLREQEELQRREAEEKKRREAEEQKLREVEEQKRRDDDEWKRRKHSVTPGDPTRPNDDVKVLTSMIPRLNGIEASCAFGDVFLAEDSHLPKKFAVKKVKLAQCDQDTINEIRKSFQRELSTLKRFHHPNIIVLYGYNLNASLNDQFLVYEYAANGSLDGFLRDDGNRARLTADIRLSIMFEVARAVNFLHSGGCEGWKVFHRDIKSANICLAEDFTARLIDCGLAKFVPDENLNIVPGSVIPSVRSTTGGPAFGTPGYMCPEYVKKKGMGKSCPYIAAFDVYSIGIVMVELILGCLINGQSTRNGTQFDDVFEKYVKDEDDELIVDGWKILEQDADPSIIWDPRSFRLVCKTAIRCITPSSKTRLSTSKLLDELRTAITETPNPETNSAGENRPFCIICNQYRTDMACSEGHPLCSGCIGNALGHSNGYHVSCLIDRCSSQPFQDEDLFGRVSVETYNRYIEKKVEHAKLDEILHGMRAVRVGVERNNQLLQEQQEMLQRLASGLERSLAALSLLAANQFKECPNLVWVTPISVEKQDLGNPKKWIRSALKQKYKVVFICAHSGQPGHEPFEIEVPKGWITKIAPWLKLCLMALKGVAGSQGLPFPIPDLSFLDQCGKMKTLLESVIEEGANAVLSRCETLLESGTMTIDTYGQMQTLAGDSFQLIAEKAQKEKRSQWKPPQMVPVCDRNGTIMWVKGEFQDRYRV
ncbi:serine/threonine kinase [Fragilaria crotonensis]|nr:serine/threonine kinase [Fragilaria crotonensis]